MLEDKFIAEDAIKRAKKKAGTGWSLLGKELKEALICQEICNSILTNKKASGYSGAAILIQGTLEIFEKNELN